MATARSGFGPAAPSPVALSAGGRPGSRRTSPVTAPAGAARRARKSRCTRCSCRLLPWVKDRRKVPSVDRARMPAKARPIAPCRSRSASSMETARHIVPSSDIILAGARAPPLLSAASIRTVAARSGSPTRLASATSGSSPASAIRFGSSKSAETCTAAWEDCISEEPCRSRVLEASRLPIVAGHKALPRFQKDCPQASTDGSGLRPNLPNAQLRLTEAKLP